jgi:hypothetical protein
MHSVPIQGGMPMPMPMPGGMYAMPGQAPMYMAGPPYGMPPGEL